MAATPNRPGTEKLDQHTKHILQERDGTFERDKRDAVYAKEAIKAIRQRLKNLQPR